MFNVRWQPIVIVAAALALFAAGPARAQRYGEPMGSTWDKTEDKPKPKSPTGTEKNGRYEETEVAHSWFSLTRPVEKTPEAQFERAEKFRQAGKLKAAGKAYHALVLTWPRSPQAAPAQRLFAEMLEQRDKFQEAFEEYDKLIDKYLGNFDYTDVIQRQFKLAEKMLTARKGRFLFFGGWKAPERAIPMFESILKHAPRWDGAAEAQYLIGNAYELNDELDMAIVAYMSAQHRYPESPFAEKAAFGRAHCLYALSGDSPNDEEAMEQAYSAAVLFLNSYKGSESAATVTAYRDTLLRRRAKAAYDRGLFYDRVARRPKAALMSYETFVKMFPNSEWTPLAKERIAALRPLVDKDKVKKPDET